MNGNQAEQVYETLCGSVWEKYAVAGVENAFCEGSVCAQAYEEIGEAYASLRKRLRVRDEDDDVERIINSFYTINRELSVKMFEYGSRLSKGLQYNACGSFEIHNYGKEGKAAVKSR